MEYTVNQLYHHLFENPLNIYDIFKGFFGEDYIDMQLENPSSIKKILLAKICDDVFLYDESVEENYNLPFEVSNEQLANLKVLFRDERFIIYVWWPHVTVTNEFDKSVNIQDLYAKIEIQNDGRIPYECSGFLLNRATYSKDQFVSDYMHSHINGIPKSNFTEFLNPCLGRGPIKETIGTLKNEYDEATWMLFCQELSMYVTVESIAGVPWRRMEAIGSKSLSLEYRGYNLNKANKSNFMSVFTDENLKNFIQYYLKYGHLSIRYVKDKFTYGMPYIKKIKLQELL